MSTSSSLPAMSCLRSVYLETSSLSLSLSLSPLCILTSTTGRRMEDKGCLWVCCGIVYLWYSSRRHWLQTHHSVTSSTSDSASDLYSTQRTPATRRLFFGYTYTHTSPDTTGLTRFFSSFPSSYRVWIKHKHVWRGPEHGHRPVWKYRKHWHWLRSLDWYGIGALSCVELPSIPDRF